MTEPEPNCYPIIYVRGYAMTESERDDTAADPFCGFNLGSTVYRFSPDRKEKPRKFTFESTVLRLMKDYKYQTVIDNGLDLMDEGWSADVPQKSIVILRYYDQASGLLGSGEVPSIETFGEQLNDLIVKLQKHVCRTTGIAPDDFRCYLVAHSMGGLVCRAFLQNDKCGSPETRALVDKFFTYASPHNGIEMANFNVPSWLTKNDISNFNRENMRKYLGIENVNPKGYDQGRADWIQENKFPSQRIFCLIGSDRSDYTVAMGSSQCLVGAGSDGLVRIENASVWGVDGKGKGKVSAPCATAYVYRAHSGYFGIVNSEEAYQNLTRFLFGNLRVDIWFDVTDVQVPGKLRSADKDGKVDALYQIDMTLSPKGKPWNLTRRRADEDSPACLRHKTLREKEGKASIYLSSSFLSLAARLDPNNPALNFRLSLGIHVPDYIKDRTCWFDEHFEGGYLFRDALVLAIIQPQNDKSTWSVMQDWESEHVGSAVTQIPVGSLKENDGKLTILVPVDAKRSDSNQPSITGNLRFEVSEWK